MKEQRTLEGVYTAVKKDGSVYYRASITYCRKHISLGSFQTMETAHQAYVEAGTVLNDFSLSIDSHKKQHALSFHKWVCLVNFRDNHLYFATPIYVYAKFFRYYFSKEYILTFDIDDLFYYASHKIMKRNGHLFVADYGMQVNIMNRYGIKNYAVLERDYRFVNGDSTDFRYENIEILNTYHGVSQIKQNGTIKYRTVIHIKGNYLVGTYSTSTEAAIAYNKAIDILNKAGVTKQYTPNYMEGISPSAYADIYTSLKISAKIIQYKPPTSPNNQ